MARASTRTGTRRCRRPCAFHILNLDYNINLHTLKRAGAGARFPEKSGAPLTPAMDEAMGTGKYAYGYEAVPKAMTAGTMTYNESAPELVPLWTRR